MDFRSGSSAVINIWNNLLVSVDTLNTFYKGGWMKKLMSFIVNSTCT